MLGTPSLYSVDPSYHEDDPLLEQKRSDIVHTAAVMLEKSGLIRYDRKTGVFRESCRWRLERSMREADSGF